jgi:hypothetical protein
MEHWLDGRPDGMARSSGRLTGNRNLHRAKSSESALNSGIPVENIFTYTSDFVQTQIEAKILTKSKGAILISGLRTPRSMTMVLLLKRSCAAAISSLFLLLDMSVDRTKRDAPKIIPKSN